MTLGITLQRPRNERVRKRLQVALAVLENCVYLGDRTASDAISSGKRTNTAEGSSIETWERVGCGKPPG